MHVNILVAAIKSVDKSRNSNERHATIAKQALHWDLWLQFCREVNQTDPLRNITSKRSFTKINYFEAFSELYRHNYFSQKIRIPIWSGTISESLSQIGAIFEDNSIENPVKIPYSTLFVRDINKLLLSYKEEDPPTKRQASLPLCVFNALRNNDTTILDQAISELTNGALYFAMRSCEYSTTSEKNPRTKRLRVRNMQFYNSRGLRIKKKKKFHRAHRVTITFENQKNGEKMETITRTQGRKSSQFKPVLKIWANIVTRIQSYEDTGPDTFINVVCVDRKLREITASMIGLKIKACVDKIGIKRLGFTCHDVGTHLIWTSFASMLLFQQVDTKHIMLQGCWKSNSVFRYIKTDIMALEKITRALQDAQNFNIIKLT